jgi:hypothetical protein
MTDPKSWLKLLLLPTTLIEFFRANPGAPLTNNHSKVSIDLPLAPIVCSERLIAIYTM